MYGCEGFEIAIEMRLHGAAERDGSERLDAHLKTCEGCRRFEMEVKTSEKTMRESGDTLEGAFNATKARETLRRTAWEHWIDPLVVAAGFFCFIAFAALNAWVSGDPFALAKYPRVIVFFAAVTALFVLRSAQTMIGLNRAEKRGEELLSALRRDVGRRFRATVFATIVLGGLGLFSLLLALFKTPSPRHDVGELLFVAGLIGGAIYNSTIALPRLSRERAELA